MVGDHIVLAAHSAGLLDVLIFSEQKLGVSDPAVALPACDQPAAICLLRIFGIVDDVADGLSHRAAFAGVQGHQARSCHVGHLLEKKNGLPQQTVLCRIWFCEIAEERAPISWCGKLEVARVIEPLSVRYILFRLAAPAEYGDLFHPIHIRLLMDRIVPLQAAPLRSLGNNPPP